MITYVAFAGIDLNSLIEAIRNSGDFPWIQGWFTSVSTFFFENVVCWTIVPPLISEGILHWMTALQATFWGVFIGDLLMYLPVRFAMHFVARLRWVRKHQNQIELCSHFFDKHLGKTMFVIRFTPGIRTPALLAAGMLRVHFGSYTLYSALSCLFQSVIVTFFMPYLYAPAIAWLKHLWTQHPNWVIAIIVGFFLLFCVAQWYIARAVMRHLSAKNDALKGTPDASTRD